MMSEFETIFEPVPIGALGRANRHTEQLELQMKLVQSNAEELHRRIAELESELAAEKKLADQLATATVRASGYITSLGATRNHPARIECHDATTVYNKARNL